MNKAVALLFFSLFISATLHGSVRSIDDIRQHAKIGDTVEIRGTVTGLGGWFANLHDGTAGITVYDKTIYTFCQTGDVLTVSGTLATKAGMLHVMMTEFKKTGVDHKTAAPICLTPTELTSKAGLSYRSVSLTGTVADAFRDEFDPDWVLFFFSPINAHVAALIFDPSRTLKPIEFIDSEIRITGNYNLGTFGGRPHLGPHVVSFFGKNLHVLAPARTDPFESHGLSNYSSPTGLKASDSGHRRLLSGTVLATWNGDSFFLQTDQDLRVRVHLITDEILPSPGTRVTVAGFPNHNIFFTEFANALFKAETSSSTTSEIPTDISPVELLNDNRHRRKIKYQMDGHLVRIRGKVLSVTPAGKTRRDIFLLCENETIKVEANELPTPKVDSLIEVTGICRFFGDENRGFANLQLNGVSILPRTTDDIRLLKDPPWWTPMRALTFALILIVLVIAGLVWNLLLQKLVARKGRELARESLAHLKAELRVDERMALAVELHDTIAQNLTGVTMQLEGIDAAHRIASPQLGDLIRKARHSLDSCCVELRNCLWDLRNNAYDSADVSTIVRKAITPHLGSATADVALDLPRSHISDSTFHALLSIIRELVINAIKHGHATHIGICGEMTTDGLRISVKDNGCGFDPANRPGSDQGHFGLLGIQERLDRIGGTLDIASSPGDGAAFSITIES